MYLKAMAARDRLAGRWGLVGMRERARRLRAMLEVRVDARGTAVRLQVLARFACRHPSRSATC